MIAQDEQIRVTLPDGSVREYPKGSTGLDIAAKISEGLARNVLAAKVNGLVQDATRPIDADANVQLLTWNDAEGKATFWHSSAHLLAEALEALYPGVKFGIGPLLKRGFITTSIWGDSHSRRRTSGRWKRKCLNWPARNRRISVRP